MKTTILKTDAKRPNADVIRLAAQALQDGKVVAFPTETVYGLGACDNQKGAIQRIYDMKKRSAGKPMSYHIANTEALERLHVRRSSVFRYFKKLFWPGPVTLIVWNEKEEKVGIRFPKHEVAMRLIEQAHELVVATSANSSGDESVKNPEEVIQMFDGQVDVIIDAGTSPLGEDSTIIDLTVSPPVVLRSGAEIEAVKGAIKAVSAGKYPRKKILIVCTGNTCRSPMAEAWLHSQLQKGGLAGDIEVSSCGTMAREGGFASPETMLVVQNDEINMSTFRSHLLNRDDVMDADLILVMTQEHQAFIQSSYPHLQTRIINLQVDDPVGMSYPAYERTYKIVKEKLQNYWKEIVS